jgi:hypothetical protein
VFDYAGRPAPRIALAFHAQLYGDDFEWPFVTDDRGRFCVLAVPGRFSASIVVPGQRHASQHIVRSTAPVDPRFASSERFREVMRRIRTRYAGPLRQPLIVMEPVPGSVVAQSSWASPEGAQAAVFLWNPETDAARRCRRVEGDPPWYRFKDRDTSWQYAALTAAPLLTLSLFVFGIGARRSSVRQRSATWAKRGRRAFQATCAGGVVSAVLFVVLWYLV